MIKEFEFAGIKFSLTLPTGYDDRTKVIVELAWLVILHPDQPPLGIAFGEAE